MSMSATTTLFLSMAAMSFIFMTVRRFIAKKRAVASSSGRLSRWMLRLRSPEWRRYGVVLFAGKFAGLAILAGVVYYFNPVSSVTKSLRLMRCSRATTSSTRSIQPGR
jgi:hypothetical protein